MLSITLDGMPFIRGIIVCAHSQEINRAAARYLTLAWDIWGLKIDLERRILSQGEERVEEYLGRQLELLRSRTRQYDIPTSA